MRSFEKTKKALTLAEFEGNKSLIESAILNIFNSSENKIIRKGFILSDSNLSKFDSGAIILALDSLVNEGILSEIKSSSKLVDIHYKKMTKIVLDTNVLIDGFKDEFSYEKRIIDAVRKGEIEAFANRQTLQENKFIVNKIIQSGDYQKELDELFTQINWVINRRQIRAVSDREDNKILESAVEAKADFLITSDNALLRMKKFRGIKIVMPIEFWSKYKDEGVSKWQEWINYIKHSKAS